MFMIFSFILKTIIINILLKISVEIEFSKFKNFYKKFNYKIKYNKFTLIQLHLIKPKTIYINYNNTFFNIMNILTQSNIKKSCKI